MTARYVGRDQRGTGRTGSLRTGRSVAEFVAAMHGAGWQALTVKQGGDVVGSIEQGDLGTGRRTWWADQEARA